MQAVLHAKAAQEAVVSSELSFFHLITSRGFFYLCLGSPVVLNREVVDISVGREYVQVVIKSGF